MNPEKPSGIHPISAPSKAPDAPPFPKTTENPLDNFIKRQEETKRREANRPTGWKGLAANLWGNALVRFGLGTLVIGGGAYEAYQNVPAIHSTVDNLTGQGIPETFDNNADKQTIKAGVNAVQATEEQIREIINRPFSPILQDELPNISMVLPIKLKEEQLVDIEKSFNNMGNPITNKNEKMPWGNIITIKDKNTPIPIPIQPGISQMEVFLQDEKTGGAILKFTIQGKNSYILIFIQGDTSTDLLPTDNIKEAPINDMPGKVKTTRGLSLSVGTPILLTNKDDVRMSIIPGIYTEKYPRGLPASISFTQDPSGKAFY